MKNQKFLFIFIFLACFLFCPAAQGMAKELSVGSQYLLDQGKMYYEKGDIEAAITTFSKALLVDANNKAAHEYLKKLGVEGGLYGVGKDPEARIADFFKENQDLKAKSLEKTVTIYELEKQKEDQILANDQLKSDNLELKGTIGQKEEEVGFLKTRVKAAKGQCKVEMDQKVEAIKSLEHDVKDNKRKVSLLKRITRKHIKKIDEGKEVLSRKDQNILGLKAEINYVKNDALQEIADYEDQLDEELEFNKQIAVSTKRELKKVKEDCKEANQSKKEKIERLKNNLKQKEQELSKSDRTLRDTNWELKEKEQRLASLPPSALMEGDYEKMFAVDDDGGRILDSRELLRKRDRYIADLKDKLARTLRQLRVLEKGTGLDDAEKVAELKDQIRQMEEQLGEKEFYLKEKDESFNILEERLADAKQRIGFIEEVIKEKDYEIKELERKKNAEIQELKKELERMGGQPVVD